jgi:hypothetical protein
VKVLRVGISGEGRDVLAVQISRGEDGQGRERGVGKRGGGKMGFVITGAQHAREVSTTGYPPYALSHPPR